MNAQAKDERPLSPMFNGAEEGRGRPEDHQPNVPMSPAVHGGSPAQHQAEVHGHDSEHLAELPSPIRSPDQQSDGAPKQEEIVVPVLMNQPQRTSEMEP